jgi:hypothetical protein
VLIDLVLSLPIGTDFLTLNNEWLNSSHHRVMEQKMLGGVRMVGYASDLPRRFSKSSLAYRNNTSTMSVMTQCIVGSYRLELKFTVKFFGTVTA